MLKPWRWRTSRALHPTHKHMARGDTHCAPPRSADLSMTLSMCWHTPVMLLRLYDGRGD
jgi:hypothetical protein